MAKTRPGASKKAKARARKGAGGRTTTTTAATTSASMSPEQQSKRLRAFMEAAWDAMTQGDLDTALDLAREAFRIVDDGNDSDPSNVIVGGIGKAAVLALLGEIRLESGDVDEARVLLLRAAALDPDGTLPETVGGGADKFLYLAQLSEEGGQDTLAWFRRGVTALRDRQEGPETSSKLAQVFCAMAEVWMTDLSFEDDCERECEALVTEATLLAPDSPEVWQTLASVRVSQDRSADARAALKRSLDLWEGLPPDDAAVPAFSVRVGLVRLLLTVGWLDKAAQLARARLLREDDEAVEVWYLAGYAHYLQGQELREGEAKQTKQTNDADSRWKEQWIDARRCLGRCLREFRRQEYEDEQLGQHAATLLEEVVAAVGPAPEEEEADDWVNEYEGEEEEEDEEEEGEDEDHEMEG